MLLALKPNSREPGQPAKQPSLLAVSAGTANSRARPRPQPPPKHCQPLRTTSGYSSNSSRAITRHQCAVCSARGSMGNSIPSSTTVITLLAAPFIRAQDNWSKVVYVYLLTKPLRVQRGYGNPVRGFRCRARRGYRRPRSEAPRRRARLCLPAGERRGPVPALRYAPAPRTWGRRRRGRSAGPGAKGEQSAGVTPPGIATTTAR